MIVNANNRGEGGIMALMTLINQSTRTRGAMKAAGALQARCGLCVCPRLVIDSVVLAAQVIGVFGAAMLCVWASGVCLILERM